MKVLIACEFSGVVREAFRKLGHDAWSCDVQPSDVPGCHIQESVMKHLIGWDLIVAFPPCTHLCASGAQYWPAKRQNGLQQTAMSFVMTIALAECPKIAIENPVGIISSLWRRFDQIIEPFQFGDPYKKRTCLWLKGLPKLIPTKVIAPVAHWHGGSRRGGQKADGSRTLSKLPTALKYGERERSRTFQGIADAMASQWGE